MVRAHERREKKKQWPCAHAPCRFATRLRAPAGRYFRFYMGRRLSGGEDERQMGRWKGVCGDTGRWRQNLIAKCLREGGRHHPPIPHLMEA